MGKLVGEREHPCRLRVGAIYKNKRCEFVAKNETAKLLGVEGSMAVQPHDCATSDQYADALGSVAKGPERLLPGGVYFRPIGVEAQFLTDTHSQGNDVPRLLSTTDEVQRTLP